MGARQTRNRPFRRRWEHCGPNRLKPCTGKPFELYNELESEVKKEIPVQNIALWAWRSTRLFAFVLVVIAVVVGAHLRLHRLARFDMSGDEGASWAAASTPSAQQVAEIERRLDPGKLALYDLILHEWIGVFGDGLFAMRALSAALGTIAIVLVFVAVREVCRSLVDELDESARSVADLAGAFAALVYATNLEMVLSDRAVRMYPLVMCAELLQITFFFALSVAAES